MSGLMKMTGQDSYKGLDGTALERDALSTVLDNIEGGVHVRKMVLWRFLTI